LRDGFSEEANRTIPNILGSLRLALGIALIAAAISGSRLG
jgi:hypothetical protein